MVVCLCSCVSDKDVIKEILNGYDTLDLLVERLNVMSVCGSCQFTLEDLIAKHKVDGKTIPGLQFVANNRTAND